MLNPSENKNTIPKIFIAICVLFVCFVGCSTKSQKNNSASNSFNPGPIDIWHLILAERIKSNWISDTNLQKINPNLNTIIFLKVLKDGSLEEAIIEEQSGNDTLDAYALAVVKKAAPFPPLPDGKELYKILIKFSPKGLM